MCPARNNGQLGNSMYWVWRLRLLTIRFHLCSMLYMAYVRMLFGLKVAAQEVQQPHKCCISCVWGSLDV